MIFLEVYENVDDKNFNLLRHQQYVLCCALFVFCLLILNIIVRDPCGSMTLSSVSLLIFIIISGIGEYESEGKELYGIYCAAVAIGDSACITKRERRIIIHSNYNHNLWRMKSAENLHIQELFEVARIERLYVCSNMISHICVGDIRERLVMKVSLSQRRL